MTQETHRPHTLEDLSQELLSHALSAGADQSDILAITQDFTSIDVRNGQLENAERAEHQDIGLRVIKDGKQAIVSSSNLSSESLKNMAERAVLMANEALKDPYIGLADPEQLTQNTDMGPLELCDMRTLTPQDLKELALDMEAHAADVEGVSQVQSASAQTQRNDIYICASNGFNASYQKTSHSLSCMAISGEGTQMDRDYDYDNKVHIRALRAAKDIGLRAGERAAMRQGARRPQTGSFPVLFDERIASSLISHISSAINGAAIAQGTSWLRDHMGKKILPDGINLDEHPHRKHMFASRLFDAEGLPTQERRLVSDGQLTGWTLDLETARKLNMTSTANASRGLSQAPSPSLTNLTLTQGTKTKDNLLKDMGTGLLVTSFIGATINPNTGDYSRGASGFWVENGEICYPVHECTIASNLILMLKSFIPANDARAESSLVIPSLLVENMTIAGQS